MKDYNEIVQLCNDGTYSREKDDGLFSDHLKLAMDHPGWPDSVFDAIYAKAWKDGHAFGYSEVLSHFSDLVEFVEGILSAVKKQ